MNRRRWYSTATTLVNGETYIQGGLGGTDFPEIRGRDGKFRVLTSASTSAIDFMYPRNSSPRMAGCSVRQQWPDVLRRAQRCRFHDAGRAIQRADRQRCQRGDVPPRPHSQFAVRAQARG